jgi:hypothetical protein
VRVSVVTTEKPVATRLAAWNAASELGISWSILIILAPDKLDHEANEAGHLGSVFDVPPPQANKYGLPSVWPR